MLALGDAIRRYAASDDKTRAEVQGPLEIRAIANAFNEMADQLERLRSQQLIFVASVAVGHGSTNEVRWVNSE